MQPDNSATMRSAAPPMVASGCPQDLQGFSAGAKSQVAKASTRLTENQVGVRRARHVVARWKVALASATHPFDLSIFCDQEFWADRKASRSPDLAVLSSSLG